MKVLSRDEILSANDLKRELVEVPEWGGSVYIQGMTGEARDEYEAAVYKIKGKKVDVNMRNLRAQLVARTVTDEDGNRLFSAEDVEALGRKSGAALDRVFSKAQRLNRLSQQDIEDLTKN